MRFETRSWWGQAWVELLDQLGAGSARAVQRGGALVRRGAVSSLQVRPGAVTADVAEDRVHPYQVAVRFPPADDAAWAAATAALARELRFTAALLDGELAEGVQDTLAAAGVALLPSIEDLAPACPCPDRSRWCRHATAVHLAAGAQLDRDPALLLRFRGRELDVLLREVRTGAPDGPTTGALGAVDLSAGLEGPRGDLDAIPLHPEPVHDPAARFRHLGDPPGVDDVRPLEAIIARAAAAAWRLAAGDGSAAADEELLLAELRARRVVSVGQLAEALGRDPDEVREELDRLYADGAVLRTGSGDRARYRAAAG